MTDNSNVVLLLAAFIIAMVFALSFLTCVNLASLLENPETRRDLQEVQSRTFYGSIGTLPHAHENTPRILDTCVVASPAPTALFTWRNVRRICLASLSSCNVF